MKLVHWPLTGGLFVTFSTAIRKLDSSPPRPLLAIPNVTFSTVVQPGEDWAGPLYQSVTTHPSTASVPMTILLYNGPLLCSFNVPIKGLTITYLAAAMRSTNEFHFSVAASSSRRTHCDCLRLSKPRLPYVLWQPWFVVLPAKSTD